MTAERMGEGRAPSPKCGTEAGYSRHHYLGEPTCGPCRTAHARERRARENGRRRKRSSPRCGTVSGYHAHLRRREASCEACREAIADYQRARYHGEKVSFIHDRITQPSVILDVMETYDYPMPLQAIISHVTDLHPEWNPKTLREVMFRLKREGKVDSYQRLGEWMWRLA